MRQLTSRAALSKSLGRFDFDPRARIVTLALCAGAAIALSRPGPLAVLTGLAAAAALLSGLPRRELLWRLLPVNLFMLLLWITLALTAGPPYSYANAWIKLSQAGLDKALLVTLKANAIVLATSAVISTTELSRLAVGLAWFKVPVKIVWLLLLTYRYAVGLAGQMARAVMALKLRAAGGKKLSTTAYAGLFARTFLKAQIKGERLAIAMAARGFGERLALDRRLVFRRADGGLILAGLFVSMLVLFLQAGTDF